MIWRSIGASAIGTYHVANEKQLEDALCWRIVDGTLICLVSDGAGSASEATFAAQYCVNSGVTLIAEHLLENNQVDEAFIYSLVEHLRDRLITEAQENDKTPDDYLSTILGCILSSDKSIFFQIGDGAIVRQTGEGIYSAVWWPDNGEYQNHTHFLIEEEAESFLKIQILDTPTQSVALFTDGLQLLTLNYENQQVHAPFFDDMFKFAAMADSDEKQTILNQKLAEYLNSERINARTDDDKTLFLATLNS